MSKKAPQETRQKLIQAAIALLVSRPTQFTLDEVAAHANVSKGGLLHHFPTKESLLLGLVEVSLQSWTDKLARELEQEPEGVPGRRCRAYIRATFDLSDDEQLLNTALAKARNIYPALLADVESTSWRAESDDGLPPGRALLIVMTCDGLWFGSVSNAPALSDADKAHLRAQLEQLTYDA